MIKNQKQASITKNKLADLIKAKIELESKKTDLSHIEYELAENAFNSLINDLENQIKTYESLTNGNFHCLKPKNLEDISNIFIAARLAQKLSQKDLADILGIKEQQVQRYEASDFEGASLTRIVEFSMALNLQLSFEKIIIINTEPFDDIFEYPEEYSKQDIEMVEEKIRAHHSFIF